MTFNYPVGIIDGDEFDLKRSEHMNGPDIYDLVPSHLVVDNTVRPQGIVYVIKQNGDNHKYFVYLPGCAPVEHITH